MFHIPKRNSLLACPTILGAFAGHNLTPSDGGICKRCPNFEGEGLSKIANLSGQGRGLTASGHPFQCVSVRDRRAFKFHFISIFLC